MPQQTEPFRMTFDDEFKTFVSSPDGSSGWMTALPYYGDAGRTLWGNGEAQYYSDKSVGENPFSLSHGILSITASPSAPGSTPYGQPYDSGVITTYKSFAQTYGMFEVRAELPAGQGLWPAFWLLPADNVYSSELDVFEQLGNDPTTIYSTTHGATGGQWSSNFNTIHGANSSTGFHTYGVDWEPKTTTFFVDGHKTASVPTPASMNQPMYMILNLAVGGAGSWPGVADPRVFPATMKIQFVRAYASANTTGISGSLALNGTSKLGTAPSMFQADTLSAPTLSADDWSAGVVTKTTAAAAAGSPRSLSSAEHGNSAGILPHQHSTAQMHGMIVPTYSHFT